MIALVPAGTELAPPRESLGRLFLRFLKFGSLVGRSRRADRDDPARARGRGEMVSPEHFNRVLALYAIGAP